MPKNISLVATSIGDGAFLDDYVAAMHGENLTDDICLIIIPDLKTPQSLYERCEGIRKRGVKVLCPTVAEQDAFLKKLGPIAGIIPYNSDNRRNVGFLMAMEEGSPILISVDDDNYPRPGGAFFADHRTVGQRVALDEVVAANGWYNVCQLMDVEPASTYPRGFPYRHRHENTEIEFGRSSGEVHVNAGLWLGHPDIDAVSCLYAPARTKAFRGRSVLLGQTTWSPINTQNTSLTREALAAYYFLRMGYPVMGLPIDRDGDIFSGYFVQACARHLGHRIRIGTPIADHRRNAHNYLKDLTFELACIWILEDVTEWLHEVQPVGKTYVDSYLCLAELIEQQVERFKGFIWTDSTRGYFHYIAYCMRCWIEAIRLLGG
jgi:hypothetical protein